jgi:hypothetical protein
MPKCLIPTILTAGFSLLTLATSSCAVNTNESFKYVRNGDYNVVIRDMELAHSGTHNLDICVSLISDKGFPTDESQCFFHGYDVSGLKIDWKPGNEIHIRINDGTVSLFRNYALVSSDPMNPVHFHVSLQDESAPE